MSSSKSHLSRLVPAAAALLALAACQQRIEAKEDLLVASGFSLSPANTAPRQAFLASLPPHKFVRQTRDGRPIWIYADPTICHCLYAGNEAAYQNYRINVFQQNLANERQMTAEMNQDTAMDWGMWGPWAPYAY